MISRATGTADRLRTAADFFSDTQRALRDAGTTSDLHKVAGVLDSANFDALPPGAREYLVALYALRLFQITGALHG